MVHSSDTMELSVDLVAVLVSVHVVVSTIFSTQKDTTWLVFSNHTVRTAAVALFSRALLLSPPPLTTPLRANGSARLLLRKEPPPEKSAEIWSMVEVSLL